MTNTESTNDLLYILLTRTKHGALLLILETTSMRPQRYKLRVLVFAEEALTLVQLAAASFQ